MAIFIQCGWRKFERKRRLTRAARHWQNRNVSLTFRAWKRFMKEACKEKEALAMEAAGFKALRFWGAKTVSGIFMAWRDWTRDTGRKRKKAMAHWVYRNVPKILVAWRSFVDSSVSHRVSLCKVFLMVADIKTHNSFSQKGRLVSNLNLKRSKQLKRCIEIGKSQFEKTFFQTMGSIHERTKTVSIESNCIALINECWRLGFSQLET